MIYTIFFVYLCIISAIFKIIFFFSYAALKEGTVLVKVKLFSFFYVSFNKLNTFYCPIFYDISQINSISLPHTIHPSPSPIMFGLVDLTLTGGIY